MTTKFNDYSQIFLHCKMLSEYASDILHLLETLCYLLTLKYAIALLQIASEKKSTSNELTNFNPTHNDVYIIKVEKFTQELSKPNSLTKYSMFIFALTHKAITIQNYLKNVTFMYLLFIVATYSRTHFNVLLHLISNSSGASPFFVVLSII